MAVRIGAGPTIDATACSGLSGPGNRIRNLAGGFVPSGFEPATESAMGDTVEIFNSYTLSPANALARKPKTGNSMVALSQQGFKPGTLRTGIMNGVSEVTVTKTITAQPRNFPLEKSWTDAVKKQVK